MTQRVAVVDNGLSNVDSVRRALEECGAAVVVTEAGRELRTVDRIVLPGVGAFPDAVSAMRRSGLVDRLREEVHEREAPLLGICLGMQLLAETGEEGTETTGLGWLPGRVTRLVPDARDRRVPHVGWNEVRLTTDSPLFRGIPDGSDFYFVHSYRLDCPSPYVVAEGSYCGGFAAAVQRGHVYGVQFHPEKSQRHGLRLLRNFLAA